MTIQHKTFTIERDLKGSPRHAFRFWAEPELKNRWAGCHADWTVIEEVFDFRAGGSEVKRWRTPDEAELEFRAHHFDVVPGERLIYAYEMSFGGERLSASLVTVQFKGSGGGTKMTFTEQTVFLVAGDALEQRIQGTEEGMDRFAEVVAEEVG